MTQLVTSTPDGWEVRWSLGQVTRPENFLHIIPTSHEQLCRVYARFDVTVDEGKGLLHHPSDEKEGKHHGSKAEG